ncbi:hypothetical protein [Pararhizobium sp. PWRC1-1]|uniref:hypothetical protein n=1 Tax=Pararhizobium sp. PWRC1-1 TaxID=2804566 RepID=UPI003CFB8968
MTDDEDNNEGLFLAREWTPEELSSEFNKLLADLNWTAVELTDRMMSLGDYREYKTILRGVHRAIEGQVKPSGEMMALLNQMVRVKRRLTRTYAGTVWSTLPDGSKTAKFDNFTITLLPKSRNRWKVHMTHEGGYSPEWPRWQDGLETAKATALLTLDNAQNTMFEFEEEEARKTAKNTVRAVKLD